MQIKAIFYTSLVFCIGCSCLAAYGTLQFCNRNIRFEAIDILKIQIIELELKVEEYERINQSLPVLRQLLTPLVWAELEALAERTKQQKNTQGGLHEHFTQKR